LGYETLNIRVGVCNYKLLDQTLKWDEKEGRKKLELGYKMSEEHKAHENLIAIVTRTSVFPRLNLKQNY
jgi:hypothetical protein